MTVGRMQCPISDVTDDTIICGLRIPQDIMFDNRRSVKVSKFHLEELISFQGKKFCQIVSSISGKGSSLLETNLLQVGLFKKSICFQSC